MPTILEKLEQARMMAEAYGFDETRKALEQILRAERLGLEAKNLSTCRKEAVENLTLC